MILPSVDTPMSRFSDVMASLTTTDVVVLFLATSFFTYLYFKRYEPQTPVPLFFLLIFNPSLLVIPMCSMISSRTAGIVGTFAVYNFLILLYTVVYRLSPYHPLARFPGPVQARVSMWWSSYICAHGKKHIYYKTLHDRYGDVVRVGPNELSIRDVSAVPKVLGPGGLSKGPWWDNRAKPPPLIGQRDPVLHARQRKAWNRAFSSSALKDYEAIVARRVRQLIGCLEETVLTQSSGRDERGRGFLDISAWFGYFATDFMGDISFGGGFELMEDRGDKKGIWHIFESGLRAGAIFGHVPWSIRYLTKLPGQGRIIMRMRAFGSDNVAKRMAMDPNRKDLFYYLSGEDLEGTAPRPSFPSLSSEGILAIIAGSDTTSTILTVLFYYLLQNPSAYESLKAEIDAAFSRGEEPLDASKLSGMEWVNGCINEALRLQPPVPSGSQRKVLRGMGPKVLGDVIVPEETQLFVHTYSIQRDARNFSLPDLFLPQRWFSSPPPEIVTHNTAAFIPFSYGPTICAGKNLALLEMRMVICWILLRFDVRKNKEHGISDWADNLEDLFVMQRKPLWVDLVDRP